MLFNALLIALALCRSSLSASVISTFTDTNCQKSFINFTGPNGYPDGFCTDLRRNGAYGSFQIISLDPGCAVTIYGNDTTEDPCSAPQEYKKVAQPITCYNATYLYYSIDMCDPAVALPSNQPVEKKNHTGAIAGGVIGGVVGLALILGAIFWIVRKKRAEKQVLPVQESGIEQWSELQGRQQNEIGAGKVVYRREAVEVEAPPVELSGEEIRAPEKTTQ